MSSVQHLASAINQAVYAVLLAAVGPVLPLDVDANGNANRVDGTGATLPTIYNDWKVNTSAIFDQVCFFLTDASRDTRFRGPLMKSYFLDIEVWTKSRRQDSAEKYYSRFSPLLDSQVLDLSLYDPACRMLEMFEVASIDLTWNIQVQAYRATYRYRVVAGRTTA